MDLIFKKYMWRLRYGTFLYLPCKIFLKFYRPHLRDGGRYCFQFASLPHPRSGCVGRGGGCSHPRLGQGILPSQVRTKGYPHFRSGWEGILPSQVRMGDTPIPDQNGANPVSRMGYPLISRMGVPSLSRSQF